MTDSAFQWSFDKAENLSINRKKMVSTTTARDGTTRAVSRGTPPKIFTVKLADGMPWSVNRDNIIAAEALDKITTASITIKSTGLEWYYGGTAEETYTVRCTEFPDWSLTAHDQVSWSGPFVFVEVI